MAQNKSTIVRDSVFRTTGRGGTSPRLSQGINLHQSRTRQTAVWLDDAEVAWLDTHIQEIKRAGWRTLTRSAFIRALIRAAMQEADDFTGVLGEADLIERLGAKRK